MQKMFSTLVVAAVFVGGLAMLGGVDLQALISLIPKGQIGLPTATTPGQPVPPRVGDAAQRGRIRVASFNIQVFGQSKLDKPAVANALVQICRQFDVIAVQEIRSKTQDVLPRFLQMLNADGSQYDYAISPRLGRTSSQEQYAFIYDTASIEMDRALTYVVGDPDDLMHREPFVGAFRVRGLPEGSAFTFTLVNLHTDPDEVELEVNILDDVFLAVRRDGRGEDDIIMLGDFNTDSRRMGELGGLPDIFFAIQSQATNTRGTEQYDNLAFSRQATTEFTGSAGVYDMLSELGINLDQALEISDHLPVWADFSVYEGGELGPFAQTPAGTPYNRNRY